MAAHNLPVLRFDDFYAIDSVAQVFWRHWLDDESRPEVERHLRAFGIRAAKAAPWAVQAERNPPRLMSHDACGDRIDAIEFHPAYRELESLSYGGGIVALKYDANFLQRHRKVRHLAGFGAGYYFAQSEAGLYCPICMTDGVGWVLEKHGRSPLAAETLERIASRDLDQLWQGAMYLTERQGGSDVGANETTAWLDGDRWRLRGHKWFCSNVSADVALVLARMPDAPSGTAGLGLFLLAKDRPTDNHRRIRIERLKDKLGTRSMATGEVSLEDAEAELIGAAPEGVKMMLRMVGLSRIYNAVASVAAMRRAITEALAFGMQRRAFGRSLYELPLWRASVADLHAEFLAAFVTVFETVRTLDRAEGGDADAERLTRLFTPICKAMTARLAVFVVTESMEAVGGNAYIETSIFPRLLRDAHVLPIWEGTTNILALDLRRALGRGGHLVLLNRLALALKTCTEVDAQLVQAVQRQVDALSSVWTELQSNDDHGDRPSRIAMERAWRAISLALLLEAAADPALRSVCEAACRRLLERPATTAAPGAWSLDLPTEDTLLRAAYPPVV